MRLNLRKGTSLGLKPMDIFIGVVEAVTGKAEEEKRRMVILRFEPMIPLVFTKTVIFLNIDM